MEFKEVINKRRSIRKFKETEVPITTLQEIIRIAERTPSWENSQPWNVYIATGETLKKIKMLWHERYRDKIKGYPDMPTGHRTNFSKRSQKSMEDFLADVEAYTNDPNLKDFIQANEDLFNAPALVYLTLTKDYTSWQVYDLGAFGMNVMLAAKDLGIDSIPAYEIVKFPDVLRPLLSIPEEQKIITGIALGYAREDIINTYTSVRFPIKDILTIKN